MAITARLERETGSNDETVAPYYVYESDRTISVTAADAVASAFARAAIDFPSQVPTGFNKERVTNHSWRIQVLYQSQLNVIDPVPPGPPPPGVIQYRFNYQAQPFHALYSLEDVSAKNANGQLAVKNPNIKNLVGIQNDNDKSRHVGLNISVPAVTFTLELIIANVGIGFAYQKKVEQLGGHLNNQGIWGAAKHELFLASVSGGPRSNLDWQINFGIAYKSSRLQRVGPVEMLVDGHNEIWAIYEDKIVNVGTRSVILQSPLAVYVDRVWPEGNFSTLNLPF
jgi:hypothetical protein